MHAETIFFFLLFKNSWWESVHVYIFPKNLNTYEDFWLVPGIESDVWISDEHLRIIAYEKFNYPICIILSRI
jgi:hypothetical protein